MMGGKCSSADSAQPQPYLHSNSPSGSQPSMPPSVSLGIDVNSMLSAHICDYEVASQYDTGLQSFNAVLYQKTNKVLMLAKGNEDRSLPISLLGGMCDGFLDTNREAVRVILEQKKEFKRNKDVCELVNQFFDNSKQTLSLCNSLDKCLKHVVYNQMILKTAVKRFEAVRQGGSVDEANFDTVLQALALYKAARDPFTEEFTSLLQSVIVEQDTMLKKLTQQRKNINKKLTSSKTWQRISYVILASAIAAVLICTVVAAAVAAPPAVTALLGVLTVPIGSVGKWFCSLWDRYKETISVQGEIIDSMSGGARVVLKDLQHIRVLIDDLEDQIQSLKKHGQFALTEEGSVKIVMEEIQKNLEAFEEDIERLCQHNGKCYDEVVNARKMVLHTITKRS